MKQSVYLIHWTWNQQHHNEYHWGRLHSEMRCNQIRLGFGVSPSSQYVGEMTYEQFVEFSSKKGVIA